MSRLISFSEGEFYHLYNRGTEKRNIFMTEKDRERFLVLLYLCNQSEPVVLKTQGKTFEEITDTRTGETLVDIVAYCLMPNHFHILAREKQTHGISKFMQKVTTGYSMYINKRYERTGTLFQGKFKATHVDDDRYLAYLISYIHLNPITLLEPKWKEIGIQNLKNAENYLNNYQHSTYLDYLDQERVEELIINKSALPNYFSSGLSFKRYINEWLSFKRS